MLAFNHSFKPYDYKVRPLKNYVSLLINSFVLEIACSFLRETGRVNRFISLFKKFSIRLFNKLGKMYTNMQYRYFLPFQLHCYLDYVLLYLARVSSSEVVTREGETMVVSKFEEERN